MNPSYLTNTILAGFIAATAGFSHAEVVIYISDRDSIDDVNDADLNAAPGASARGIYLVTYGKTPGDITYTNSGHINVGEGSFSRGIELQAAGEVNLTNTGNITTRGGGGSVEGILVTGRTAGKDINIDSSGNVTSLWAGIKADGEARVDMSISGNITVGGSHNDVDPVVKQGMGIGAYGKSAGSYVHYAGGENGKISMADDSAIGILARSNSGAVRVDVDSGTIETTGDGSTGIRASVSTASNTNDLVVNLDGAIITHGNSWTDPSTSANIGTWSSWGINASHSGKGDTIVTMGQHAAITTTGDSASGIYAISGSTGHILVGQSDNYLKGSITTSGASAHGVMVSTSNGDAAIYNDAHIRATGTGSSAAYMNCRVADDKGTTSLYNTGAMLGETGVIVTAGVDGGLIRNRGSIATNQTVGNAIRLDGSNVTVDVVTSSTETGMFEVNGSGNILQLGGAAGSKQVNRLTGTTGFDRIVKMDTGEWIVDQTNSFKLSGDDLTLHHQAGRFVVNGSIDITAGVSTRSIIDDGATLAGTGLINNSVNFNDGAVFEVDMQTAFSGSYMTVGNGLLDGDINIINWVGETLPVGTCIVVLEALDSLTGTFSNWAHLESKTLGANIYEMRYTDTQAQLWITGWTIPEPSSPMCCLAGMTLLLARKRRR